MDDDTASNVLDKLSSRSLGKVFPPASRRIRRKTTHNPHDLKGFHQIIRIKHPSEKFSNTLYETSELVGLVKNGFNSMLNLGLYLQRVVGYFNIYTELVTWKFS